MARIDRPTSQFMDAARWMSALAVVLAHAGALMLVDEAFAPQPSPFLRLLFALKNIGHLAVVIFFVLSGYLVGGQELLRVLDGRRFDPARYAIQRFSRIYTVLIPALLLTLLLDQAGQHFLNQAGLYTNPANGVGSLQYAVSGRDDLPTFLGNLLLLQTVAVEPLGGDGPLWSLANEWWYYVAFGLSLVALSTPFGVRWRIAAAGAMLLILALMPWPMLLLATIWLLGVAAAVLGRQWPGLSAGPAAAILAAGLAAALVLMAWSPALLVLPRPVADVGRLLIDLVPAIAFAVALLSARNLPSPGEGRLHRALAGFSFSLYAVHFPILLFLAALANTWFGLRWGRPPDLVCAGATLALTALICLFAAGFAHLTERHTNAVRAALTRLPEAVAGRARAAIERQR